MKRVSVSHAKTSLSRLLDSIENGTEREIVICRRGRPVAKLVPLEAAPVKIRIGVAKKLFVVPDNFDRDNAEIARLFHGDADD